MTQQTIVYDAIRTPRGKGKADGRLHEVKPISLLSQQLEALQRRNKLDTSLVSDVVIGCVSAVGEQGGNIAKAASMASKWHESVSGVTLNRFCASGLEAINTAAMKIASGFEDLVVAGGIESMSRVPMGSDGGAWALDPETNLKAGFMPQGIGADLIATIEGFTREEIDAYALSSHTKAAAARSGGYFQKSQIPLYDQNGLLILDYDEMIRADSSIETLAQLKPSFAKMSDMGFAQVAYQRYPEVEKIQHVHTAANSSGISDGAAVVLLGSEKIGLELGLRPRARLVSAAVVGSEPTIMLTGPGPATRLALKKAGLRISDIDLFEVNEAFAAVVLKFQKEMDVPFEKINVNGGAIAIGHPVGASGLRIMMTMMYELRRRGGGRGVAAICGGLTQGEAVIIAA